MASTYCDDAVAKYASAEWRSMTLAAVFSEKAGNKTAEAVKRKAGGDPAEAFWKD